MKTDSLLRQFAYINDYINEHGYAPSIREIQSYMGFSSISSAHRNLVILLDKGLLETDFTDGKIRPRAYRVARDILEKISND